jgi:hypothetical protein
MRHVGVRVEQHVFLVHLRVVFIQHYPKHTSEIFARNVPNESSCSAATSGTSQHQQMNCHCASAGHDQPHSERLPNQHRCDAGAVLQQKHRRGISRTLQPASQQIQYPYDSTGPQATSGVAYSSLHGRSQCPACCETSLLHLPPQRTHVTALTSCMASRKRSAAIFICM